jgi:hypothetical protein
MTDQTTTYASTVDRAKQLADAATAAVRVADTLTTANYDRRRTMNAAQAVSMSGSTWGQPSPEQRQWADQAKAAVVAQAAAESDAAWVASMTRAADQLEKLRRDILALGPMAAIELGARAAEYRQLAAQGAPQ